jgi:hypothetical protein
MALIDLWQTDRPQITAKRIDQLIAFAGEGELRDGNQTSTEFRSLLKIAPSDLIGRWIEESLDRRFSDFGFVVQDAVNEIGRRLGFDVEHGVYRSHANQGWDGLWRSPNDRAIVVESKSSTSYSIDLARIANYRGQVSPQLGIAADDVSILIVVGTEDTSNFEAQVRGSRFAWDVRLIGVTALLRLLKIKETLDDPKVARQIQDLLFPQEFTRLDSIIDLVFATAEDSQEKVDDEPSYYKKAGAAPSGANFHAAMLPRLEEHFGKPFVKRSRVLWATADDELLLSCQASKKFEKGTADYWFGLKRTTRESLEKHPNAFCAFGLGSPDRVLLLPASELVARLDDCFTTLEEEGAVRHWHLRFVDTDNGAAMLIGRKGVRWDVSGYLLPTDGEKESKESSAGLESPMQ